MMDTAPDPLTPTDPVSAVPLGGGFAFLCAVCLGLFLLFILAGVTAKAVRTGRAFLLFITLAAVTAIVVGSWIFTILAPW